MYRQKNISVHPNPTSGSFFISTSQEIKTVSATDILGRETQLDFEENKVNCENLSKGIYLLNITLSNKQHVFKKIIID
ncbi:MAG: T9SS type A sorting domain-containing protein [Sphingobacteriaceae bacterium]|nr:T9SS type A sorting domain-containing protein [Sphingobacteriaceae bacterium]